MTRIDAISSVTIASVILVVRSDSTTGAPVTT